MVRNDSWSRLLVGDNMADPASYLSLSNTKTKISEVHVIDSFSKRPSNILLDWYETLDQNFISYKKFYYDDTSMAEAIAIFKQQHNVTDFPIIFVIVNEELDGKYQIVYDENQQIVTKINSNGKTVATIELQSVNNIVQLVFENIDDLLATDFIAKYEASR